VSEKFEPVTVWVAQAHQMEDIAVEVFVSLGAAEHWAVEGIDEDQWRQYSESLSRRGEQPARLGIDPPIDVLGDWYGPVATIHDDAGETTSVEYGVGGDVFLIIERKTVRS
jgi:hypothetical protein